MRCDFFHLDVARVRRHNLGKRNSARQRFGCIGDPAGHKHQLFLRRQPHRFASQ
jgi:hypothetical protein